MRINYPNHSGHTGVVEVVERLWGGVPGIGLQRCGGRDGAGSGGHPIAGELRVSVSDGVCADESDGVSESEAHLSLEHLVDGPATQLRIG